MISSAEHKAGMRKLAYELRHKGHTRHVYERKQRDMEARRKSENLLKEQAAYEASHSLPKIQISTGAPGTYGENPALKSRTIYYEDGKAIQEFEDGKLVSEVFITRSKE